MKLKLATNLDAAVWAACPYIKPWVDTTGKKHKCLQCPQWEKIDGERYQRMCRGIAEEIIKPALEAYRG